MNKRNLNLVKSFIDKNEWCNDATSNWLAPDTMIKDHLIMFWSGNMICTNFIIGGTFTKLFDLMNGNILKPNNKKFIMNKCMINRWYNNLITEFHIFGDSLEIQRQLNIPKSVINVDISVARSRIYTMRHSKKINWLIQIMLMMMTMG